MRMTEHKKRENTYLTMTENLSGKVASTRKSLWDFSRMTERMKNRE